ncbi:MAG: hypothetical protein OXU36_12315, partial [Candidatus Poribacteria bacterium]|nr:hypothetical protein [Candidatus Poribacteria bacterium]
MRTRLFSLSLMLLLVSTVYLPDAFAQDYTQWDLPEGAKVRLGKGSIYETAYSRDWSVLAVAGTIGIWLYDAQTGEELNLLIGHTGPVGSVAFSPDG